MGTKDFRFAAAMCAAGALACGCVPFGTDGAGELEEDARDSDVAVVRLGVTATSTHDVRSVHLRGARRAPADPKYPCATEVDVCVDVATMNATDDGVRGLCPSANLAPGSEDPSPSPWDFDLAVFETEGCAGTAITGGVEAGLVCYGASSFGVAGTENRVVGEMLAPGKNSAQVICVAKRAQ